MAACEGPAVPQTTLEKIESFLTDPAYLEILESSATYNSRLTSERRMRLPFLDTHTGVAQNHSDLFKNERQRMPGLLHGQIYSYPCRRWCKRRRQYLMGHMGGRNSQEDGESGDNPLLNEDSKDSAGLKDEVGKDAWYYEDEMMEMDGFDDPDGDSDFDYDDHCRSGRKKKRTGKGSGGRGRSGAGGRSSVASGSSPKGEPETPASGGRGGRGRKRALLYDMDNDKPFACELCSARYKTRPGLTYHYTHTHKETKECDVPSTSSSSSSAGGGTAPEANNGGKEDSSAAAASATSSPPQPPSEAKKAEAVSAPALDQPGGPPGAGNRRNRAAAHAAALAAAQHAKTTAQAHAPPPQHVAMPPPPHMMPQTPLTHHQHQFAAAHAQHLREQQDKPPGMMPMVHEHHPPHMYPPHPHQPQQHPPMPPPHPQHPPQIDNPYKRMALSDDKARVAPSPYCDFCLGDSAENRKTANPEELVSCSDCGRSGHPSCLQFTPNMIISVRKYRWQCIECKCCSICGTSDNDDQLLFCDDCDRGYHMYCLAPPLSSPPEGSWSCGLCLVEFHRRPK